MTENVFLFVPNIVDYLRVITAFVSFYYMPFDPWKASFWYLLSGFLDAIDGHLARLLDQSSKLGALLDQLIDRCATMCLCGALCYFYPDYLMFFQFYMALDITSHWFHLQSTLMKGAGSHKVLDLSANPILRHYYHNRKILFVMCSANELFFCMLYLTHFSAGPALGIGFFSLGLWQIILYLTAPLAAVKTFISCLQLWAACKNIAAIDVADREAARQEAARQKKE